MEYTFRVQLTRKHTLKLILALLAVIFTGECQIDLNGEKVD